MFAIRQARRGLVAVTAAGCLLASGCGVTPETYCDKFYDGADPRTPQFAIDGNLFHDAASCMTWYRKLHDGGS